MIFTPMNNKKFVNISVISLKKNGKMYEIGVYPNKLYEYYNSITALDQVICSYNVYKNISKGEICSQNDLEELFNDNYCNILDSDCYNIKEENPKFSMLKVIEIIIKQGYERKDSKTKDYELTLIENVIIDLVSGKVIYNKAFVDKDKLRKDIKKFWTFSYDSPKKQTSFIIKKLVDLGYEKVKFKLSIRNDENSEDRIFDNFEDNDNKQFNNDDLIEMIKEYKISENCYAVSGELLHNFIEKVDEGNFNEGKLIEFEILEEVESEEIC